MSGIRTLRHNRIDLALHELRGTEPAHPQIVTAIRRAGADFVLTYFARHLAELLTVGGQR